MRVFYYLSIYLTKKIIYAIVYTYLKLYLWEF